MAMQMFREIIENLDVHHPIPLPLFPDSGNPAQLNYTVKKTQIRLFYDKKSSAADHDDLPQGTFHFIVSTQHNPLT
jgi:hypothetical protein